MIQFTPDAVGQRLDHVEKLIATDLQGIPNGHLYDGQTSIYDLAETAFGGVVTLREHFRCVPEIIQFSNHPSYGQTIRPLRESSSAMLRPAFLAHRAKSSRAVSSAPSTIWRAKSCDSSATITKRPLLFAGATRTKNVAYHLLYESLKHCTRPQRSDLSTTGKLLIR
jgi:hypothetical protein